jgi:hypothetical protein
MSEEEERALKAARAKALVGGQFIAYMREAMTPRLAQEKAEKSCWDSKHDLVATCEPGSVKGPLTGTSGLTSSRGGGQKRPC